MTAIADFLTAVWDRQRDPGYGTIARKRDGLWIERYVYSAALRLRGSDLHDLYFTPNLFAVRNHRAACVLQSRWLYADLDDIDPTAIEGQLEPTVWWPTSPGHWQALWLLDRPLRRDPFEELNKRLTYHLGADHNGWDAGQLLRLPFTVNTKRTRPYHIKFVCVNYSVVHRYHDLAALLRHVAVAPAATGAQQRLPERLPRSQEVLAKHRRRLPHTVLITLRAEAAMGDRSGTLWHLYARLFKAGLTAEEVFVLAQASVWNKWPHRPDRLWQDVCKGQQHYERAQSSLDRADLGASPSLVARARREKSRG